MYRMLELFTLSENFGKDQGKLLPDGSYNLYEETIETKGNGVNRLLSTEMTRLDDKKKVIDSLYDTKQRVDGFVKSETLKKQANNKILVTLVLMVIASLLVLFLRKNFPLLPDVVYDLCIIAIIGIGIIRIIWIQVDIFKRDHMDFEKVNFNLLLEVEPTPKDSSMIQLNTENRGSMCVGSNCCPTGQFFVNNKCERCPVDQNYDGVNGKCVDV
jgi:hypothetical protein